MKNLLYLFSILILSVSITFAQQIVSTNADDGPGSLRAAITAGNSTSAPYSITFTTAGPISLNAVLPEITQSCTITGQSPLVPATATGGTTIERSSGAANFRILKATTSGLNLVVQDLILQNGVGAEGVNLRGGGAVLTEGGVSLTMNRCLVRNCQALLSENRYGGAIHVVLGAALITDCQFSNNTGLAGGAVRIGPFGGLNSYPTSLIRCTFDGNTGTAGGALSTYAPVTVVNCTFSNNQSIDFGNAIRQTGGYLSLIHCTFSANGGATRTIHTQETLELVNNLFVNNTNIDNNNFTITGTFSSKGGNVSSDPDGTYLNQPSDKNSQTLTVGPLQRNNGGLVATHRITSCSPAYNAGVSSSTLTLPATDANNQARINPPDAGAYEVQTPTAVGLSASNSGVLNCANPVLMLTATLTGGSSGTYVFSGPGLSTTSTSNSTTVNQAGSYSVTVSSAEGCTATNSITVSGSPTLVQGTTTAGAITTSGPASCASPARLTAPATGQSFVFTGPGGYVFSNVYRNGGSYTAFAEGVKLGGTYTLTVYSACSTPTTSSIVVQRPSSCL